LTKEIFLGDQRLTVQIWDTAGQERFKGLGSAFFRGADGCLLVYDITDDRSFEGLAKWRDSFVQQTNCSNPDTFPFLLLGNKLDREPERRVIRRRAQLWSNQHRCIAFYEVSAKEGSNVDAAFSELCRYILHKREEEEFCAKTPNGRYCNDSIILDDLTRSKLMMARQPAKESCAFGCDT